MQKGGVRNCDLSVALEDELAARLHDVFMARNSESLRMASATLASPSRLVVTTSFSVSGEQAKATAWAMVAGIGVAGVVGVRIPGQAGVTLFVRLVDFRLTPDVADVTKFPARTQQRDERRQERDACRALGEMTETESDT